MEKKSLLFAISIFISVAIVSCNNTNNRRGSIDVRNTEKLDAEKVYNLSKDKIVMLLCYDNGIPVSQGSGFFIDEHTIITNYHVVEGTSYIEYKFPNEETIYKKASLVKAAPDYDIAVISTEQSFPSFAIDSLGKESIGSKIYCIGNPRGFEGTISEGILSGKRESDGIEYLQITAPISHGNSGGPILNEYGEVIGIATFSYRNSQNLNFAMPIKYISRCVENYTPTITHREIEANDEDAAVEVVAYSKLWSQPFQSISFKNNSEQTISSISGVLVFSTRRVETKENSKTVIGQELTQFHYQVINLDLTIAPQMAKMIEIPVDHVMRSYSYCKDGCWDCNYQKDYVHFTYDFILLSYEIEE